MYYNIRIIKDNFSQFERANPKSSIHFLSSPAIKYEKAESKSFLNCSSLALVGLKSTLSSKLYSLSKNLVVNDSDSFVRKFAHLNYTIGPIKLNI